MSWICKIFGHETPMQRRKGWFSPGQEYAHFGRWQPMDATGVQHRQIVYNCDRCGEKDIPLCRIHLPRPEQR